MAGALHDLLVQKAARWCLRTRSCSFALCEPYSAGVELPDVLAWQIRGWSILVECKATRADFLADRRKACRRIPRDCSLGQERWYAVGPGVADTADCPEGWGMLKLSKAGRFARLKTAPEPPFDLGILRNEFVVLLPALRKAWGAPGTAEWLKWNPYPDSQKGGGEPA